LATRVAWDEEGDGDGGKSNGNKGGGCAMVTRAIATVMATSTTWVMVTTIRLAGNTEGKGRGSKSNGNGNEGGGRQRGQW
jgi:hypothetical protein